jgi:hypothetical protein
MGGVKACGGDLRTGGGLAQRDRITGAPGYLTPDDGGLQASGGLVLGADGALVRSAEKKRFSSRPSSNITGSEPDGVPRWNGLTGSSRNTAKPEPQSLTSG